MQMLSEMWHQTIRLLGDKCLSTPDQCSADGWARASLESLIHRISGFGAQHHHHMVGGRVHFLLQLLMCQAKNWHEVSILYGSFALASPIVLQSDDPIMAHAEFVKGGGR